MRYWDQLEICHLSADSFDDERYKSKWSVGTFHGDIFFQTHIYDEELIL